MKKIPLFPSWMIPGRNVPKPATSKLVAIFPDGMESDVVRKYNPINGKIKLIEVVTPTGKETNTLLKDLKGWVSRDFPGVRFERRPIKSE